jgi:hypothetical protein
MSGTTAELDSATQQFSEWAEGILRERRPGDRFSISSALQIVPLDNEDQVLYDDWILVAGKNLSVGGIAFSHMQPLSWNRAVVSYVKPDVGRFAAEIEIVWTRPTPLGHYESGCRFIRKLPSCDIHCKG